MSEGPLVFCSRTTAWLNAEHLVAVPDRSGRARTVARWNAAALGVNKLRMDEAPSLGKSSPPWGSHLRTRSLKATFPLAVALIALLLASLGGGCATQNPEPAPTPTILEVTPPVTATPPTGTPITATATANVVVSPLPAQPYSNNRLGITLSYPDNWLLRETENGLLLGTLERVLAGGELESGAGLAVEIEPLPNAEWESPEELCLSRASVFRSDNMHIGQAQALNIDRTEGVQVELQGSPPLGGTPIRGFVALAIWDHWTYTFVALATDDEWSTYGTTLYTIVEGARFLAHEEPPYAPDPWEPDDTTGNASLLEPDSTQIHDLHRLGDRDYVRFEATRGYVYTIETANLGEDIDTRIFLYDGAGNLLTHNDDGRSLQELWASRLVWTATKTSPHYVMVQDVGDDSAGPDTSYDLRLWEEVRFVEDEYEADDSARLATLLEPGTPQVHNLHVLGDVDWMRVDAKAGSTYVFETFDLGADVDTVAHLLNEEGNELAVDDNGRDAEQARASRIQWHAISDAQYYIRIHDAGDDAEGPATEYWVKLTQSSP